MLKIRFFLALSAIFLTFGVTACTPEQTNPTLPALESSPTPQNTLTLNSPTPNALPTSTPTPILIPPSTTPAFTSRISPSAAPSTSAANGTPTLIIAPTVTAERSRTQPATVSPAPLVTATATPFIAPVLTGTEKLDAEEQNFVLQLNEYRRQNKVNPLVLDNNLIQSARWMAQDLATHNTITHTDSLGRDIFKRIKAFGYSGRWVGENIAGGFELASDNLKIWQSDDIHKNNLLGPNYTKVGVGRYYLKGSFNRWHWVLDLG